MRYGLLTAVALCAAGAPARAQTTPPDTLTVEAAVHAVLGTHPAVARASEVVTASEARVRGAKSGYYPQVDAVGSYTRVGPTPAIDIGGGQTFLLFPANNYLADLGLRQTVYDFGKRSTGTALARTRVEGAGEALDLTEVTLAYGTIETFYTILYLQESLQIQRDNVAALGEHLDAVRRQVEAGTATEFDVLTTQVRIARAQNVAVEIASLLEKRRIALRELLGAPADAPLALEGQLAVTPVDLDRNARVTAALAQRPEVRLSRTAQAGAELDRRLAALGNRPDVSLDLSVGAKNGYQPNLNTLTANFTAGVAVDLPVFDGFRTRSAVAASDAELRAAEAGTQDVERQVVREVDQSIADVRASGEKIGTAELQVQQAEQALAMAQTRYTAGVITNLDLLDVQTALAEARLLETKARLDFVLARYALERASGEKSW
jgi:outer membrane protein